MRVALLGWRFFSETGITSYYKSARKEFYQK